jgi:hypothetical protein
MITFDEFIKKYDGKTVANPNGSYPGQCVSLCQMYLKDCFGQPFKARGNGNAYAGNLISSGLATKVSVKSVKKGDIISYPAGHDGCDPQYGHVAIYYDKNHVFQQNVNVAGDGVDTMTASLNHGFKPKLDSSCTIARMKGGVKEKSATEIAEEVIDGKWGNGETRKKKLESAGYDYETVQAKVNELLGTKKSIKEIAQEVIDGKWGNGTDRKNRLTKAGYDYSKVQAQVNSMLNTNLDKIAKEVIQGKWGIGATRKARLQAAGYDYNKVQAKVNQLLKK